MKLKQFKRFFDSLDTKELNTDVIFVDKSLNHCHFQVVGIKQYQNFWSGKSVCEVEIKHIGTLHYEEPKKVNITIEKDTIYKPGWITGKPVNMWKVYINGQKFEAFSNKADALELKDRLERVLNG